MYKLTGGPQPSLILPSKLQGKIMLELNVSSQILLCVCGGGGVSQGHRMVGKILAQLLPIGYLPVPLRREELAPGSWEEWLFSLLVVSNLLPTSRDLSRRWLLVSFPR